MIKPWLREDTIEWIALVENRIEDMIYYKEEARKWCEQNNITDRELVMKCMFATCIWVSHMRMEEISYGELYDLMIDPTQTFEQHPEEFNNIIGFRDGVGDLDLPDLLIEVVNDELES